MGRSVVKIDTPKQQQQEGGGVGEGGEKPKPLLPLLASAAEWAAFLVVLREGGVQHMLVENGAAKARVREVAGGQCALSDEAYFDMLSRRSEYEERGR
jgi:hypothetical protein